MLGFGNSHIKRCRVKPHRNAEHQLGEGCSFRCASFAPLNLLVRLSHLLNIEVNFNVETVTKLLTL